MNLHSSPPCAVSEVVVLADLCTSLCVSPARGSISVGDCWGRQHTVASVGGGPRREEIGAQKDRRVEHHTSKSSLKVSQRSSGSLYLAEELVIANDYLYGVNLEEVGHQSLVLYQFEATEGCVMCGNDKEAVPCLHPGLEVRDFPGRRAFLVTAFSYSGLGSLNWHYIIYCRQQVIKINVITSPDDRTAMKKWINSPMPAPRGAKK